MPQYSGVWTLQQQGQALTSQQWVTDPNFKNTTLLLQADNAANTAQNNTFLDSSTNSFAITRNGNTTQGSFTPFSQASGYWGNYFGGNGNYLSNASGSAALSFGTNNFTVEFWIYPTTDQSAVTWAPVINIGSNAAGTVVFGIKNAASGTIKLWMGGYTFDDLTTTTITPNAWYHIAFVRSGTGTNQTKVYINGVNTDSFTHADNFNNTASLYLGYTAWGTSVFGLSAYVSNLRVTTGAALYTSTFTPPSSPLTTTASSGTVAFLSCQSNRFLDSAGNITSFTTTGSPSVQAFSPFAPQYQWTPSVIGGSGYFNGSTDYLSLVNNTSYDVGTGDFCIEAMCYKTNTSTATDWRVCGGTASSAGFFGDGGTTSSRGFGIGRNGVAWDVTTNVQAPINSWFHICFTRKSGAIRIFLNGSLIGYVASNTTNYGLNSGALEIASASSGSNLLTGYMCGFRLLKSVPTTYDTSVTTLNTQVFTPPSAPLTTTSQGASSPSLLLNYTNAGIYDGTMNNDLQTVGSAQVSTAVVKYGSGSMYFDGSSYLKFPFNQIWNFGTGDFTVEMFVYYTTTTRNGAIISNAGYGFATADSAGWSLQVFNSGANLGFNAGTTQNNFISANSTLVNSTLPNNQWLHIAVTRANSNLRCFVNGTQVGSTFTSTSDCTNTGATYTPKVGADQNAQSTYMFTGYMDDVRITKGVARYLQNFTPPQVALPRQ